jgi:hypothetical protein
MKLVYAQKKEANVHESYALRFGFYVTLYMKLIEGTKVASYAR